VNRRILLAIGIFIALIVVAAAGWWLLAPGGQANPRTPDPVVIGVQPIDSSGLLYIAEDRHFFSDNGLAVTIRDFDPPVNGVTAMQRGEVDLASATEYPVVMSAFNRENISILTKHVQVQTVSLFGRRDRGITNASDLRGKTIGVTRGTLADFYLGRFLTLHGMELRDVALVDVQPGQFATGITTGRIDALVCWEPYSTSIRSQKGDTIVEWPVQSGQPAYGVIVARNDWIAQHPDLVVRFLRSLNAAAEYTTTHPAESRAIVRSRLNLSDSYIAVEWPRNQFGLSLDQSLVLTLEDEARWMIANNLTNATAVPDFGKYIYTKGMEQVKPGSVNIVTGGSWP